MEPHVSVQRSIRRAAQHAVGGLYARKTQKLRALPRTRRPGPKTKEPHVKLITLLSLILAGLVMWYILVVSVVAALTRAMAV